MIPIVIQVILAVVIGVGSVFFISEINTINESIRINQAVSDDIKGLTGKYVSYFNNVLDYSSLQKEINSVMKKLSPDMKSILEKSRKELAVVEKLRNRNEAIKKEIMDMTSFSISQSNNYINSISAKLASGATEKEVSLLERAVISGANANNNNNYTIKVMFLMMEKDPSLKDKFFSYIDDSIKQASIDIENLKNTPFAALPKNALDANMKIKDLAAEFVANSEKLNSYRSEILSSLNSVVSRSLKGLEESVNRKLGEFRYFFTYIPFVLGGVILLIILLSRHISRSIISQIESMSDTIKHISTEGDLTRKIEIKSRDEIGEVSADFNRLIERIKYLIENIKSSTDLTGRTKENIVTSSDHTSSVVKTIKGNTSSLLKEAESLDSNVENNINLTETISKHISDIDDKMTELVSMVDESTAAVTEMMSSIESVGIITENKSKSINQLASVVDGGSATLTDMVESFREDVLDKIEGISAMADTIQSISAQTNLLSMNAAIEAAHAGEYGKGFAVVADEIRKLADTSSSSTALITRTIKEISDGVAETENRTRKSKDAFDVINEEMQSARQAFEEIFSSTRELNVGSRQILEAITMLSEVTARIKNATRDISELTGKVVSSQVSLKDVSRKVSAGMTDINRGLEEIVNASDEIVGFSTDLDNKIRDLKIETEKFST